MIKVVIPARYGSSRLPGKPLREICGKYMVLHVAERAREAGFADVIVATDDERIFKVLQDHQIETVMTSADHQSGTDRLAEVAELKGWADDDIVVNLQGDEPLMPPGLIRQVAMMLEADPAAGMATLGCPIRQLDDLLNPNIVKVVLDNSQSALYFSRAPIPFPRDHMARHLPTMPPGEYYRHLGMYAYRVGTLKRIPALALSDLETTECLEQLRPLQHGVRIAVGIIEQAPPHGVDTADDLAAVERLMMDGIHAI